MKDISREGIVRVSTTAAIPAVLRTLGVDPAELLIEAGLDPNLFDDPDNMISFAARGRLLELCVAKTGCHHFGLLVGQQGGLSSLGLIGYLVMHSPNVESALRSLIHYFHLHAQGAVATLTLEDEFAFLGYNIYQPGVKATDQLEDGAVAITFNILHKLCGDDWAPTEVCFAHRKPSDLKPFDHFFQAPLHFDAERNGCFFHTDFLQQPVHEADAELHRLLQKQIDQLNARHRDDFPEQVRRVLRTALLAGHASEDQVAALFSIHSRTLHRRLKAFDTSFQELIDQERYEIAKQMLEDSEIELSQIAEVLDYADVSAFTRAFRRWNGTTPARWREDQKSNKSSAAEK